MNHQLTLRCLALTGLLLASIPADASTYRVIGSQGEPGLPAAKAVALTADSPRTVRMVYFLPNDRPFRAEVVNAMKATILQVQASFESEMQRHGHGALTFRFEADDQGEPLVHRVDGEHGDDHYLESGFLTEVWRAIGRSPIEVVVIDHSSGSLPFFGGRAGGVAQRADRNGQTFGTVTLPSTFSWRTLAHELGHTFGLEHDFRDNEFIMSYGASSRLSACAAEFLAVHPYLNPEIHISQQASPSTINLISSPRYPPGSGSIPVQLEIGNSSGLHQVWLFATTQLPSLAAGGAEAKGCRSFSAERTAVVEFDYDGVIPSKANSSLADPIVHGMHLWAVDTAGRTARVGFTLYERSDRHIATLLEEPGLTSLAFLPDGSLASASADSAVRIWDLGTRETEASITPALPVQTMAISPDGSTLASAHGGVVKLWDLATGTSTATLEGQPGDPRYRSVAFSPPDGATLAVLGDRTVMLWDLASGTKYADLNHDSHVTSVAFSPDGTSLASASEKVVTLWDPATGAPTAVLKGHTDWVSAVAFSPDGTTLASQSGWDGLVRLWDVETHWGPTIENLRGGAAMAFSPDGATLACASGPHVKLWDVRTRAQLDVLAHDVGVGIVAFSPDGETLATGTWKGIELWDASEWQRPRPHELVEISGDGQEGPPGAALESPLIVEVRDQYGKAIAGAPVTFAVIEGDGRLDDRFTSETRETDANGRAAALLTLGSIPGPITVEARLLQAHPVTFRLVALEPTDLPVGEGDPRKWHLPDRATVRLGKGSIARARMPVAFSSDGRRLAVVTTIGTWLYDAATTRAIDLLPGAGISCAAFSPEGALATGSEDGTVVVWDVASGESTTLYRHEGKAKVHSVAFSPDGATLAIGSWSALKLLDVADGRELWSVASDASGSLAFSPDGTTLTLTGRNAVRLWDVASGDLVTTHSAPALDDRTEVFPVALSPDGATLAIGSGWAYELPPHRTLKLWNIAQGRERATLVGHTRGISSLAFSPDGARLASGSYDRTARVWDAATGGNAATFDLSTSVEAVAFSPDGRTLASATWDDILLWDLETGSAGRTPGHALGTLALSPDGGTVAIASENSTRLVDVRTGRDAATLKSIRAYGLAFSPDGSILAVGERGRVTLWDVATIRAISTLQGPEGDVRSVAFSPDGSALAVGYWEYIRLWDVAEGESIALLAGHTGPVSSVAFSPDGAILASGAWDETARLWEVGTGQEIATFNHTGHVVVVAFSADGATLATGSWNGDGEVRLWEVSSQKEIATLGGHREVYSLAFSPDGGTLAAGPQDGTVVLYDTETWRRALTLEGHIGGVHSLAFSRDGTTLASSGDGTVLLWDLTPPPHTLRIVSGDDQEGEPGALLPGTLIVEVRDENGDPFVGAQVTFAVTGGRGTVSVERDTTDAQGRAATTLTLGLTPGPNTVEVTVGDLEPVIFTALTQSVPTTLSKVGGDAQQGASGSPLAEPFVVALLDQAGAPLTGATVTFAVTAGQGTLSVTRGTTDAQGRAATTLTLGEELGTYTVVATVAGLEPVTFTVAAKASPDFDNDGEVGFSDFFLLAEHFGGSDPRFDLDGNGSVDFTDFFLFAEHFGQPARAKLVAMARDLIGLPDGPQLRQNAPNPFNSGTVIPWFQLEPGVAHLEVFALTGQRVAVLHKGQRKAGLHRLRWDGRDERGRFLASGVYVYRLVTSEAVQTRKLTVLR